MAGPSRREIERAMRILEAAVGIVPAKKKITKKQEAALKRGRRILAESRRRRR